MTHLMPFLILVFLLGFLVLDEVQLLVMEAILVFGFFVGASDAGCERAKNIGGASG